MKQQRQHQHRAVAAVATAIAAVALVSAPAAARPATPSNCLAQEVQAEKAVYGTAWGHDVVASLASDRDGLAELGLRNLGDLAAFLATADRADCPVVE